MSSETLNASVEPVYILWVETNGDYGYCQGVFIDKEEADRAARAFADAFYNAWTSMMPLNPSWLVPAEGEILWRAGYTWNEDDEQIPVLISTADSGFRDEDMTDGSDGFLWLQHTEQESEGIFFATTREAAEHKVNKARLDLGYKPLVFG